MTSLIVLALLISSASYLTQSLVAKQSSADSTTLSLLLQAGAGLLIVAVILAISTVNWSLLPAVLWLNLIFTSAWTLGIWLDFLALKQIDASLFSLVNLPSRVILVVVGGIVVLGESLYGWQWLGLGLLILGVLIAHSAHKHGRHISRGLIYTTISAIFAAIGLVVEKHIFDQLDFASYLFVTVTALILGVCLLYLIRRLFKPADKFRATRIAWRPLAFNIPLFALSMTGYGWLLYATDNVAYLNAVWSFSSVMTVVLGIWLLKERDHKLIKISGSIVATAGFILLL